MNEDKLIITTILIVLFNLANIQIHTLSSLFKLLLAGCSNAFLLIFNVFFSKVQCVRFSGI